jgi:hypothetical protein
VSGLGKKGRDHFGMKAHLTSVFSFLFNFAFSLLRVWFLFRLHLPKLHRLSGTFGLDNHEHVDPQHLSYKGEHTYYCPFAFANLYVLGSFRDKSLFLSLDLWL